jgi:hypothetical protein
MICPLCSHPESELFEKDKTRDYLICGRCRLVFVPRSQMISQEAERNRYEAHHNSENDENYKRYIQGITDLVAKHLGGQMSGLDFGCGKTTLLANLLSNDGHKMNSYDVFFYPDKSILNNKFDFIILSEVIEHLRNPHEELERVTGLLKPNGYLFIKTKLYPESQNEFKSWFYKRDLTHIQFFSYETFKKMSQIFYLSCAKNIGEDLFLFRIDR